MHQHTPIQLDSMAAYRVCVIELVEGADPHEEHQIHVLALDAPVLLVKGAPDVCKKDRATHTDW